MTSVRRHHAPGDDVRVSVICESASVQGVAADASRDRVASARCTLRHCSAASSSTCWLSAEHARSSRLVSAGQEASRPRTCSSGRLLHPARSAASRAACDRAPSRASAAWWRRTSPGAWGAGPGPTASSCVTRRWRRAAQ
eukprot:CAMPEP_0185206400 /NCGR_PEP_ID=MMETSP1140-20130426/58384_1 /TAXON_ID=298111 /ORGANISM="Pavlova sp., Strain CCMP459" /LENGTH=139 /DNA_ID=CAMNT_0027774039 /DNA_START=117 /DNA_END=537 /DNA_ORIENTATION=+